MSTDPELFYDLGLKPSAARVLAEMIDNIDDPPDSALLMWHGLGGNLASKLAMMIEDSIPLSARASAARVVGPTGEGHCQSD